MFISVLPDHALPKGGDQEDFEKTTAAYTAGFFSTAISKQKKELKKQEKEKLIMKKPTVTGMEIITRLLSITWMAVLEVKSIRYS